MKWNEIIKDCAWVVDSILTPSECEYFIQRATDLGIQEKTAAAAGDVRHRNSTTVAFDNHEMAQRIYERIKDYIPQKVVVDEHCNNLGLEYSKGQLIGTWTPYGLNHRWRVVCYPGTCTCTCI